MADAGNQILKRKRRDRRYNSPSTSGAADPVAKKRVVLGDITNISKTAEKSDVGKFQKLNAGTALEISSVQKNLATVLNREGDEPQRFSYASLIFQYLHSLEIDSKYRPLSDYMERTQFDLSPTMRAILIDWLVEVAEEYKLVSDTLYLAVSYIDRYLSSHALVRNKLQLLGVTTMWIAAKYEEISPPHIEDFCYITDNTYTKQEVVDMERDVLNFLNFELGNPTVKTFVRIFTKVSQETPTHQSNIKHDSLCYYIAELSLLDYGCLRFIPSLIAASAVFLARFITHPDVHPWPLVLQQQTGYAPYDLIECVGRLHELQLKNKSLPSQKAVHQKYSDHQFKCVASLGSPADIPAQYFELNATGE